MKNEYKLDATNIYGAKAPDFLNRIFPSAKKALEQFDSLYYRKGWVITIYKRDFEQCGEFVGFRQVKKTFR